MKYCHLVVTCLLILSGPALAQRQTEEQCKKNVEAYISGIELMTEQSGEEQRLKGLSVKDIVEIQKSKGHCAALQEITKRIMSKQAGAE